MYPLTPPAEPGAKAAEEAETAAHQMIQITVRE